MRYEIEHPVVNDSNHRLWDKFEVTSWPLRVIDPEGYGSAASRARTRSRSLTSTSKRPSPISRQGRWTKRRCIRTGGRKGQGHAAAIPGKVLADSAGKRLFIADSNHNRIVVAQLDGTCSRRSAPGAAGSVDGDFKTARFDRPQGMALDGQNLYVADTENHRIRKVDLKQRQVTTLAGTGGRIAEPGRGEHHKRRYQQPVGIS